MERRPCKINMCINQINQTDHYNCIKLAAVMKAHELIKCVHVGIKVGLYCFNMEEFVMIKRALLAYSFNLFTMHDNVVTNAETVLSHCEVLIVLNCGFNSSFLSVLQHYRC